MDPRQKHAGMTIINSYYYQNIEQALSGYLVVFKCFGQMMSVMSITVILPLLKPSQVKHLFFFLTADLTAQRDAEHVSNCTTIFQEHYNSAYSMRIIRPVPLSISV